MSKDVKGFTFTIYDVNSMTQGDIYGQVICDLAEQHPEIVAMTADVANSSKIGVVGKSHPERFFNVGIAEQNLFGLAAGMAVAGLVPFVATFAPFVSMRALEFIRTDICYQNLNCKIIGSHAGTSFTSGGTTHHATEDLAIMRSLANMTVIVPADGYEAANAVKASMEVDGPVYIRINRGADPVVNTSEDYGFELGKAVELRDGTDITLIVCGATVFPALKAADILQEEHGISARILNMHTIKPIDREAILAAMNDTHRILTVEDHNIIGGLGSTVADVIAESGEGCAFMKTGIPDIFGIMGATADIMHEFKMDADGIAENAQALIARDLQKTG